MGSDSDLPVMRPAAEVLEKLGIKAEMTIVSAHRTPERMREYAKTAKERGLKAIIAGAGGAAHLAGMTAAWTNLPVIGVPVKTSALGGMDSLLSVAQMPGGVPVACVAISGGLNAGLLAAQIIGSFDDGVYDRLEAYREDMRKMVEGKAQVLENEK
ncbi:MAG: 5-(carboxyamino)imidazole ribonucleotide mutase [Clostridiales bacterium]|nr:5-(carboxyamino)imidazole ribonucleotide mutase [Clostridiales bacterium]MDR2749436.1 5-(carboxyamino)imidazole ribonucleotide mutase [Clostridiales bacterium]